MPVPEHLCLRVTARNRNSVLQATRTDADGVRPGRSQQQRQCVGRFVLDCDLDVIELSARGDLPCGGALCQMQIPPGTGLLRKSMLPVANNKSW